MRDAVLEAKKQPKDALTLLRNVWGGGNAGQDPTDDGGRVQHRDWFSNV